MKVQHVPWEASPTEMVKVEDGPFTVDGLDHVQFERKNWKYGGYEAFAKCTRCNVDFKAGGRAGEEGLIRWAARHGCDTPPAVYEVDEDQKLFRH